MKIRKNHKVIEPYVVNNIEKIPHKTSNISNPFTTPSLIMTFFLAIQNIYKDIPKSLFYFIRNSNIIII